MNDDELITLMKEPFAAVHMTMPLDQVVRHGRAVRTRRRQPLPGRRRSCTPQPVSVSTGRPVGKMTRPGGGRAKPFRAWCLPPLRQPPGRCCGSRRPARSR